MTTYYYESATIGQEDGTTFFWHQPPAKVGPLMLTFGPNVCVRDDRGNNWSGDNFWDLSGQLRWETAR